MTSLGTPSGFLSDFMKAGGIALMMTAAATRPLLCRATYRSPSGSRPLRSYYYRQPPHSSARPHSEQLASKFGRNERNCRKLRRTKISFNIFRRQRYTSRQFLSAFARGEHEYRSLSLCASTRAAARRVGPSGTCVRILLSPSARNELASSTRPTIPIRCGPCCPPRSPAHHRSGCLVERRRLNGSRGSRNAAT